MAPSNGIAAMVALAVGQNSLSIIPESDRALNHRQKALVEGGDRGGASFSNFLNRITERLYLPYPLLTTLSSIVHNSIPTN